MLVIENVYNKIQSLFSTDSIVDYVSYVRIFSINEKVGFVISRKAVTLCCTFSA